MSAGRNSELSNQLESSFEGHTHDEESNHIVKNVGNKPESFEVAFGNEHEEAANTPIPEHSPPMPFVRLYSLPIASLSCFNFLSVRGVYYSSISI